MIDFWSKTRFDKFSGEPAITSCTFRGGHGSNVSGGTLIYGVFAAEGTEVPLKSVAQMNRAFIGGRLCQSQGEHFYS